MDKKPVCFVSYCQEDINPEYMKLFINWLSELSYGEIDFLLDKNVKYSESYDDFEHSIFDADAIIIFFSPRYKKRCLDEKNTGVSREYKKILNIIDHNKILQQEKGYDYLKERKIVYSILYKGQANKSIPEEFKTKHYLDLSGYSKMCEDRTHRLVLSANFITIFKKSLQNITNEILTSCIEKTIKFSKDYDYLFNKLFVDTKSEHIDLPQDLFVETEAYNKVIQQQKYLVIGRKGSGKTTVKNTISKIAGNKYKGIISIIANQFSIQETYVLFYLNDKIHSDIETLFSKIDTYKLLWNAFIYIYCMFIVYKEYLNNKLSNSNQLNYITSLENTICLIFKDKKELLNLNDEEVTKIIYIYVLSNLENYINDVVKYSRNDLRYYKTDIKAKYTVKEFLNYLIGKQTYKDFHCIIKLCSRKIFITLDGFDTEFELFKKTTVSLSNLDEKNRRLRFESDWLMMFIETLLELKANSELKSIIDLCLTLPLDRIKVIKNNNRDFYKYHAYFITLSWKCNDLASVIFQRLCKMNSVTMDCGNISLYDALDSLMKKIYPNIPTMVEIERNGYVTSMPLFLYILRKSFWRPRDIIRYYCCILTLSKNQKKIDNISIKRAIKDESITIIQDEFLGEFINLYTNLNKIITLFNSKKQVLDYDEINIILKNKPIIIDGNIAINDISKKLKILYTIGFLGIQLPQKFVEAQFLHDQFAFIFTEGTSLIRVLESQIKTECNFIIHPIFTEYLFLNVNYENLICNYTWDYVHHINCNNIDYIITEEDN